MPKTQLGKWHHVAVTYNNAILRIYVDGAEDAMKYLPGMTFSTSNYAFQIGQEIMPGAATQPYGFKGAIDEVKYWDYAKKTFY